MKIIIGIGFCLLGFVLAQAQDSIKTKRLQEVEIRSQRFQDISRLPDIQSTYLWAGKKNEVINLQNIDANIAEKTPRQIFAKVPGVFVYDMDGTGNQMNISTRGLDPHRGWEFNIRKNGVMTNSDIYGYPASHYSMPMEAVERIQLVRGTGSLQYGAQFGGMLNYVTKRADTTKAISLESINSAGSFGLLSTYNAIGGKVGKVEYYAYFSKRVSKGYRDNGGTTADAQSAMLVYTPSDRLKLKLEVARSTYIYHIPGPLTDSMFYANPHSSTRSRNYFNPTIYVPSLTADWKWGANTKVSWTTSAVLGSRNSVQFDKPATVVDAINPVTLQYAPRQVDIDHFNSYTSELRFLHSYSFLNLQSSLAAGIQGIYNDLHRQQLGVGTTGTDFDLTINGAFGRDLHFKTKNIAVFAENRFQLTKKFSVSPGFRYESGKSDLSGAIGYYDPAELPNTIRHRFPLFGVSAEYRVNGSQNFYAGWSQAYRPVVLKEIIPGSVYERSDKNLKDAYGYNMEIGYRGSTKGLRWDISLFQLQYNNRLGVQAQNDANGVFYLYHTNIGNSVTRGAEIFAEYRIPVRAGSISFFTSTAFFDGRYTEGSIRNGDTNTQINGNKLEAVPDVITRNGLNVKWHTASISFLYSYTGQTFADPLNTVVPSANGAVGVVPSYGLLDINTSFRISEGVNLRVNLNNVTNKQYFTKRPSFYPGPGVWSSDGRSLSVTLGIKI